MKTMRDIDRQILEAFHEIVCDIALQIEEKLFYPKNIQENVIDMELRDGEDPF